jgi:hypothetical protein
MIDSNLQGQGGADAAHLTDHAVVPRSSGAQRARVLVALRRRAKEDLENSHESNSPIHKSEAEPGAKTTSIISNGQADATTQAAYLHLKGIAHEIRPVQHGLNANTSRRMKWEQRDPEREKSGTVMAEFGLPHAEQLPRRSSAALALASSRSEHAVTLGRGNAKRAAESTRDSG